MTAATRENWIKVQWRCSRCGKSGTAPRVWVRDGETPQAAAVELARCTRASCLPDCAFTGDAESGESA